MPPASECGIEHLEILQRIPIDHQQVGDELGAHAPQAILLPENPGTIAGGLLDHLDGMKSRLLVQGQPVQQSEAGHLVSESCILAKPDHPPRRSHSRTAAIQRR